MLARARAAALHRATGGGPSTVLRDDGFASVAPAAQDQVVILRSLTTRRSLGAGRSPFTIRSTSSSAATVRGRPTRSRRSTFSLRRNRSHGASSDRRASSLLVSCTASASIRRSPSAWRAARRGGARCDQRRTRERARLYVNARSASSPTRRAARHPARRAGSGGDFIANIRQHRSELPRAVNYGRAAPDERAAGQRQHVVAIPGVERRRPLLARSAFRCRSARP